MPARRNFLPEEQLYFVSIGLVIIKFPLSVNGRIKGELSPVRQRPTGFDLITLVSQSAALCPFQVFIEIKLKTIRQADFEFRLKQVLGFAFARKLSFPPLLEFKLPG